jgi:hypothetical protein
VKRLAAIAAERTERAERRRCPEISTFGTIKYEDAFDIGRYEILPHHPLAREGGQMIRKYGKYNISN